jgi:hypothetical protein
MFEMTRTLTHRLAHLASAAAITALAACGGGGDGDSTTDGGNNNGGGGGNATTLTCNTALFQAGSVELPSAAQMTAYAGTYNGSEGDFGPNPGDPFVASGAATLVLAADGTLTYKGVAYTADSICIDKAAGGLGRILYVHTGNGHFDIADQNNGGDLGQAWGVSPVNAAMFRMGLKP